MRLKPRHVFLKIEPLARYSPLAPIFVLAPLRARLHVQPRARARARRRRRDRRRRRSTRSSTASTSTRTTRSRRRPSSSRPTSTSRRGTGASPAPSSTRSPGERLYIHVLNGDTDGCHSFHLHGCRYGIDSDGAWPFGVAHTDGRRSDEILPGRALDLRLRRDRGDDRRLGLPRPRPRRRREHQPRALRRTDRSRPGRALRRPRGADVRAPAPGLGHAVRLPEPDARAPAAPPQPAFDRSRPKPGSAAITARSTAR